MTKPFVSIIIPTYNRSKMLRITLDSFIIQDYGMENFEIIVSNNNSIDDTGSVIKEYTEEYDNVSTIFVEQQGVHYARNQASLQAKGEILYFTDDDMIADVSLLSNLVKVFSLDTKIGVATGKIIPRFDREPPAWVKRDLINSLLSLTDRNRTESLIVSENDIDVYSCHQAIKRELFFNAGGFNPENTAGVWIGDGETGLNIKIKKHGAYFAYISNSIIEHIIPEKRTTFRYLVNRIGNEGYCNAYTEYRNSNSNKLLIQNLLYKNIFNLLKYEIKYFVLFLLGRKNFRFLFALPFLFFNKTKYELRLLKDDKFKQVVLIDDWIKNIDQVMVFK